MAKNVESAEASELKKSQNLYQTWMGEINDALKREKTFRKEAGDCVKTFEGRDAEQTPFNILYSNTETLSPALYNARPIPIVDRRYKDEDPLGKVVAEVSTRTLKFLIEAESAEYDNFDELMQPAVLDTLVTNRGLTRYKFVAHITDTGVQAPCVYGESVRWDKFLHGHARTWKKVPWIGFEWDMAEDELKKNFPEVAGKIKMEELALGTEDEGKEPKSLETKEELTGVKLARVFEIWDKTSRMVMFFSPAYKDGPLKMVEDPLKLSNFFPMPKPLNLFKKTSTLIPTPLYVIYKQQAQELNTITTRIKNLIKALRVRGFYNSTIEAIATVLDADDNKLIPVENMASMPEGMAVEKMIWMMPLTDISTTVQNLYIQREQIKQVIYEITGVSDILRGASVASETATAQNIKNQWGTLRLKKMQKEVQRFCRDSLAIILEIAGTNFGPETFAAMTGLKYPSAAEKRQAQMQVELQMKQAAEADQTAMIQAQMAGQPHQPSPPPEVPPELQALLAKPSWEEIIAVLSDDVLRAYKVDIETNSTIDAEAAQDKQDIAELLNALSQFFNGIAPLVEKGAMSMDVAKTMLLVICRRYTFGPQLEDAIMSMKEPEPEGADPAKEAENQAKMKLLEIQGQVKMAESQARLKELEIESQISMQELQAKKELMVLETQIAREELQIKQQELELKKQAAQLKGNQAIQSLQIKGEQMKMQQKADAQKAKSGVKEDA